MVTLKNKNVQATLSDKRYVKKQYLSATDSLRKSFAASVSSMYDYYPFGMPMMERSTSDTGTQTAYVSQVVYSPQYTTVNNAMAGASVMNMNNTVLSNGNGIVTYTGFPLVGISKVLTNLIPNVPVSVKINLVYSSKPMYIAVAEGSAQSPSVYSNLLYSTMSNGSINFTFTPTQPSVELSMNLFYISTPFAPLPYMSFTLDSVSYTQQTGTSSNTQLVQISNKLKGGYRFGFNGQEKVDEIAGAGNHTTAEFWEYDTRLGRRWNRDPVVKPWESSYACFANNPIWYSDVNGDDGTPSGGEPMMSCSSSGVVVKSSKLNPDKKDDEDEEDEDGKKSSGAGGGGGAGGAGGGPNNKSSAGADQLRKYSPLLQAQGFGISDNGGGSDANVYVEKDGLGHVYVEVDGTVYSYGRYNGSYSPASGSLGPLGDGVLLKLDGQTATDFISERTANFPTEKFTVKVNAFRVESYYNNLYNNGTPLQGKTGYNAFGRVIGTYNLVGPGGNNCTTLTYKALNYGGANIRPAQTPAGMLYDFRQINYNNQGYNPSQRLFGPK